MTPLPPKPNRPSYLGDPWLLATVAALSILGILFSYSSSIQVVEAGVTSQGAWIRQSFFFASGLVLMAAVSFLNYRKLAEHSTLLFVLCLGLLLFTLVFGKVVNGSRRWISLGFTTIQPSEFVKIFMVVVIAQFLDRHREEMANWRRVATLGWLVAAPSLLIFMQPDLGTTLVFLPMTLAMLFVGGIPVKWFIGMLTVGFLAVAIPLYITYANITHMVDNPVIEVLGNKFWLLSIGLFFLFAAGILALVNLSMRNLAIGNILFFCLVICAGVLLALTVESFLLKEYQRERLLAFINPNVNRWEFGYNVIQAQITVGSGGLFGKGFAQGTQGQLGFLPSRQTDFIFSVIGEETGFLGSSLVVGLFGLLLWRLIRIARDVKDYLGGLIVVGILTKFTMQVFVNVGMNIGIAPVTGIPLPFLTYGGSALWTSLLAIGIVLNVDHRRHVHH
ncbi:MAG: rod shape-determining protein RodA [Spirochaetes bacterium]|nr:rod shape-determining protein RodA [Spirochaetota bacterium]